MDYFEYQERKHCKSRPLTLLEMPHNIRVEFMTRSDLKVWALTPEETQRWKQAHGFRT